MIIVTGEVEIADKDRERFLEISRTMIAASQAEKGCHGYQYYQDVNNPNLFRPYEQWADEAALAAHFAMPHMATFRQGLAGLEIKRINVIKYKPEDEGKLF